MAKNTAKAKPYPEPEMLTICADILQETDEAILVSCDGEEVWLPISQIKFEGERGDTDVDIILPDWLAEEKGLRDGQGMSAPKSPPVQNAEELLKAAKENAAATAQELPDPECAFTADVVSVGKDGYTLKIKGADGEDYEYSFAHDEVSFTGDSIVDLQPGYTDIPFVTSWRVAVSCGLAERLGLTAPTNFDLPPMEEGEAEASKEPQVARAPIGEGCKRLRGDTITAMLTDVVGLWGTIHWDEETDTQIKMQIEYCVDGETCTSDVEIPKEKIVQHNTDPESGMDYAIILRTWAEESRLLEMAHEIPDADAPERSCATCVHIDALPVVDGDPYPCEECGGDELPNWQAVGDVVPPPAEPMPETEAAQ